MVRLIDFRKEGLEFNPWPGHGDCTLVKGHLHVCVSLHPEINRVPSLVGEINLQHTGILFKEAAILESPHAKATRNKHCSYGPLDLKNDLTFTRNKSMGKSIKYDRHVSDVIEVKGLL